MLLSLKLRLTHLLTQWLTRVKSRDASTSKKKAWFLCVLPNILPQPNPNGPLYNKVTRIYPWNFAALWFHFTRLFLTPCVICTERSHISWSLYRKFCMTAQFACWRFCGSPHFGWHCTNFIAQVHNCTYMCTGILCLQTQPTGRCHSILWPDLLQVIQ